MIITSLFDGNINEFLLAPPPYQREGANSLSNENDSLEHHNLSTHPNLLFGWGGRFRWSRRRWCRRWWRRRLSGFRLSRFRFLFNGWLLWSLGFAANPYGSKIDDQNQCEQEQDPLLHVSSPPF